MLTALALAGPSSAARVETLAVRSGATPVIEVGLSSPVEPSIHRLASPPRVYVDLRDATLAPTVARALDGSGALKQVRLGQFDARTVRLVVDLAAAAPVDVDTDGTTLRLVVGEGARAAAAPAVRARPTAYAAPASPAPAADASTTPIDVPRVMAVRLDGPIERVPLPAPSAAFPTTLQERFARRAAAEDWPGIVALYAANAEVVRRDADAMTRAAVVDALRELGLVYSARKLLGPAHRGEGPDLRIARAGMALADGAAEEATTLVAGLDDAAVDPVLVPKLRRVRIETALARGDLEGAATGIGTRAIPELRAALAHRAILTGRTATREHACRRALGAFRQALEADGGRTARAAAGAGLVQAALACGDAEATMSGLGVLAESPHPLLRRAAAAIADTQRDDARREAATVKSGG